MSDPVVSIILRSFNEGWALRDTLPALWAQSYCHWELIVIDSGSADGSVDLIRAANPRHFVQIQPSDYNPGRVLNRGMELARGQLCVFLNADATPQGSHWLRPLVEALKTPQAGAVFGRQIPRLNCQAVFANDYERCFGLERASGGWDHFFSMVSSGVRKEVWAQRGFLETLQYSEDDEFSRWCRSRGYSVIYCPESLVMHSHNYSPEQAYQRSFGEAKALAAVWPGKLEDLNWRRTVALGWMADISRDLRFCWRHKRLREWPHAGRIRWRQRCAKLAGFRAGWQFYRTPPHRSNYRTPPNARPEATDPRSTPPGSHTVPSTSGFQNGWPSVLLRRFTLDGSDALESRLAKISAQFAQGVRSIIPKRALEAVVLGGGYGRGEGGVLQIPGGDKPYNDLEFYVFVRGAPWLNHRRYLCALAELADRLSREAEVLVEFKIESLARLRRATISMFNYDLAAGHRVVFGSENCLSTCAHLLRPECIPLAEATRLLFNRFTGLLIARDLLRTSQLSLDQSDFVGRNLAKAKLALGDAVLTRFGQYHHSCLERNKRLNQLSETFPCQEFVRAGHAVGVHFKLHPLRQVAPVEEFRQDFRELSAVALELWLWLEGGRLHRSFRSAWDYASCSPLLAPGPATARNLALNLKTFGWRGAWDSLAWHYPRERLFRALALLLWEDATGSRNRVVPYLQCLLKTHADEWSHLVAAYKIVWPRFG